ncbi:hypothetical protein Sjap_025141 [Stephania japonica]|uniref:GDSL esterase/lipase n=1 Tax=Stephania japonica TaxID=461633 RepID=A0AAP0E141_9MAGN
MNFYNSFTSCVLLLQFLELMVQPGIGAKVPAIIVFGDSSVDAGNNDYIPTIGQSNFDPYGKDFEGGKATGRFCNGRLSTDFICEAFGIKSSIPAYLDPAYSIKDFATGVTFASAGTGLDNATADVIHVIPFWKELEYFKEYKQKLIIYMGYKKATRTLRESVYILSIGTNDFLENYYTIPGGRSSQFTVDEYEKFLIGITENFVWDIYNLGARKIALTSLTAFGCLPIERATNIMQAHACREDYNQVARDYNVKLIALIDKLGKEAKGIQLVYSNVYDSLADAIARPNLYGFENVDAGCCGTGKFELGLLCHFAEIFLCEDANKYIFWDSIHYSERMNRVVADYAMKYTFNRFL